MSYITRDRSEKRQCERKAFFSLPLEVRHLIYEYLLLSPIPLPPKPPQSRQYIHTAILRVNHRIYLEAIDVLYQRNFFFVYLRSALHKIAYEPFLSGLTMSNAAKIKELEIVLWGNYNEEDGDTVHFGTENFCVTLQNLIYAPKLVVSIDIVKTRMEAQEENPASANFCAFDWLMATFADEWFFNKTYFDLFRGVARFHMKRMFFHRQVQTCESRWFKEARATPGLKDHERRTLWELEERYGLPHEDGDWLEESANEDTGSTSHNDEASNDEDEESVESNGDDESTGEDEDYEMDDANDENDRNVAGDESNDDHHTPST